MSHGGTLASPLNFKGLDSRINLVFIFAPVPRAGASV
jgi:hypothetical protein